jgi:hypothetical protein
MRLSLAILAMLVGTSHAAPDPKIQLAVNAIPELAKVSRGRVRVTVRGIVPKAQQQELVQLVDRVVADVGRRFLDSKGDPRAEITLCLLGDDARYRQLAAAFGTPIPSDWGFYRPDQRTAIANTGVSVGNLRHELAHPLVGDDFPTIPAWLNEGIGSLYGTARWNTDRFEFLVNYRLRDLQRALAANTLPTIAELAGADWEAVHGDRAMVYYAMSRYVLLYVDRQGKLGQLYAALRAAPDDVAAQRKILLGYVDDKAFRAWARKLKY